MAAMFSMEITGRMYFSLPPLRKSRIVRGTKMISDTSLVTNMELKNTPKIRKRERLVIRFSPPASRTRGRRTFSCLKPSSTQSIIKRVPRVRQSMSFSSRAEGGVISRAIPAASSERVSISSFFKNPSSCFITVSPISSPRTTEYSSHAAVPTRWCPHRGP